VKGALSLRVKRPGSEVDHSPPFSAEVKECITHSWLGAKLKHRDKFTFNFTLPLHNLKRGLCIADNFLLIYNSLVRLLSRLFGGLEVFTAMKIQVEVFWVMTACIDVEGCHAATIFTLHP
jgi:hypothetical protein